MGHCAQKIQCPGGCECANVVKAELAAASQTPGNGPVSDGGAISEERGAA